MKPFRFFFFFLLLFSVWTVSAQKAPVYGKYTWFEGIEKARSENRFFLMFISQKNCAYCKELDKSLLLNPQAVAFLNEKFVMARHHVSTPYGRAFALDFHLQTTPALVLQNPQTENEPLILYGMTDAAALKARLETFLETGK